MIKDIANKHGLALARVGHESAKKLSEIIKEVLNERFCHVNLLSLLEEFDVINTYVAGETDKLESVISSVFDAGRNNKSRSHFPTQVLVAKSTENLIVIISKHKSFADLQSAAVSAIRKNHDLLDEFLEYFEGFLFDDPEDVEVES